MVNYLFRILIISKMYGNNELITVKIHFFREYQQLYKIGLILLEFFTSNSFKKMQLVFLLKIMK